MKNILTAFVILTAFSLNAQTVNPGDKSIETKFITKESYRSKWFVVRDTLSHEIAEIITDVTPASDRLTIITEYKVKGAKSKWLDTTIVALPSLVPIHHSTTNQERDMMLDFGKDIKGYYYDKMTKKVTDIEQPVQDSFFFSGFYPQVIRLLPLKDGYTAELPLFDYKPLKNGVIKAFIQEVKSSTFRTKKKRCGRCVACNSYRRGGRLYEHYNLPYRQKKTGYFGARISIPPCRSSLSGEWNNYFPSFLKYSTYSATELNFS